jgi:hypothetical protein
MNAFTASQRGAQDALARPGGDPAAMIAAAPAVAHQDPQPRTGLTSAGRSRMTQLRIMRRTFRRP